VDEIEVILVALAGVRRGAGRGGAGDPRAVPDRAGRRRRAAGARGPGCRTSRLDPDLVLVIFLPPPACTRGAFFSNLRELRRSIRPISAAVDRPRDRHDGSWWRSSRHAFIDDLSWPACFALGAIVGPTDPGRG